MHFLQGVRLAHVLLYGIPLVGTGDEHILGLVDPRQGGKLVKCVIQHGFTGQRQQRLGAAPGKRAHTGTISRHRDDDLKNLAHGHLSLLIIADMRLFRQTISILHRQRNLVD